MLTNMPETQNREWGFFGTISHHADPERAWDITLASIAGVTGCSPDATRAFLDSRLGRHFADEVSNHLAAGQGLASAINAAATTWMGWRILDPYDGRAVDAARSCLARWFPPSRNDAM